MVKEFRYRGYTVEELKNMQIDEIMNLLPARARRSLKRLSSANYGKTIIFEKLKESDEAIKTHERDTIILPSMVGKKFKVYSGKEFVEIEIKPEMIGHYIGEYAHPIKKVVHGTPGIGASRSSLYVPLK
ncbi:MAG: 30S ribosomal protein S19 [Nitrososphaeria archaeon]|nr:30S ribosomal protein S19 [Conexivisphaerales archaeon]